MINKVTLIGNLGKDPETRVFDSGKTNTSFSLATNEKYKDKSGEYVTQTEWHNITVWGRLAEICDQYLKKGMLVFIEGKLTTRQWEDNEGNKRYTTEIVAREMKILERGGASQEQSRLGEPKKLIDHPDDDLPF